MKTPVKLIDAQQIHKENPKTFEVPSKKELDAVKPGDDVKVCDGKERIWVKVQRIEGQKLYGYFDNVGFNPAMKLGGAVEFEKKHVYDIFNASRLNQG